MRTQKKTSHVPPLCLVRHDVRTRVHPLQHQRPAIAADDDELWRIAAGVLADEAENLLVVQRCSCEVTNRKIGRRPKQLWTHSSLTLTLPAEPMGS